MPDGRLALPDDAVQRVIASLIAAERVNTGNGRIWDGANWTDSTSFGAEGLALDSLELLACSEVVGRFFRLHENSRENRLIPEPTLGGWVRVVAEALGQTDGFTFATSGTTGLPKLCRQSRVTLHEEALFWSQQFRGCQRIIQTVAPHHIYGFLFTVQLPAITGWPVLDVRMMHQAALCNVLRADDLLVGFPAGLLALLRTDPKLPPGLRVVSATSGLPLEAARMLRSCGAAELVDVYGSSETGGIAMRGDPDAAFRLLPRWQRAPGQTDTLIEAATGLAYRLPDEIVWEGSWLLRPFHRADGAVQVAGVNVHPQRIAERLCSLPGVADCRVQLDTTLQEPRLYAAIVPTSGAEPTAVVEACDAWSRRRLTAPERPVRFMAVTRLPAR